MTVAEHKSFTGQNNSESQQSFRVCTKLTYKCGRYLSTYMQNTISAPKFQNYLDDISKSLLQLSHYECYKSLVRLFVSHSYLSSVLSESSEWLQRWQCATLQKSRSAVAYPESSFCSNKQGRVRNTAQHQTTYSRTSKSHPRKRRPQICWWRFVQSSR
jgi:hypothetical protein